MPARSTVCMCWSVCMVIVVALVAMAVLSINRTRVTIEPTPGHTLLFELCKNDLLWPIHIWIKQIMHVCQTKKNSWMMLQTTVWNKLCLVYSYKAGASIVYWILKQSDAPTCPQTLWIEKSCYFSGLILGCRTLRDSITSQKLYADT